MSFASIMIWSESSDKEVKMVASTWIPQFTPVVLMMSIFVINHLINNQRADRKTAAEASRLRSALAAELRAMLDLYKKNLQLIEKRADYILSTRSSVIVYRGSVARLTTLLEASLIEQIVGVFAQNERIEANIAARSNFKCGLTYQFPLADANFDEWKMMFIEAAADVSFVCRALEGQNRTSLTSQIPVAWPKKLDQLMQRPSFQA
jgi:hypothetical protein